METILSTLTGVFVGGVITWWVSRRYYKQAGKELRDEANRLAQLLSIIAHGLERHDETRKFSWNEDGQLAGILGGRPMAGQQRADDRSEG